MAGQGIEEEATLLTLHHGVVPSSCRLGKAVVLLSEEEWQEELQKAASARALKRLR
jgi:hypothetical protein